MVRCRHAGGVGIPVQQVERQRRLALEVIVDDVGPDQIVRAQHVEGVGHLLGFEIAALGHAAFERAHLLLVDEHLEVAGMGEIDLRGEKGRRHDAPVTLGGHQGERDGQERAADAIADRMGLALAGCPFDRVERRERAFAHVVLEGFPRQPRVRIDPGDDEHGEALIDAPLDEGFLRREVEDVELIDPRRHDQHRRLEHFRRRGRILDELDQLVLEHDLARREREIAANLEF